MKIKDYQCKCGCNDFFFADKGNQKGIYCSYCGKWLKWADKDEQNLMQIKTESNDKRMSEQTLKDIDRAFKALEERDELLDKIRAEIEEIAKPNELGGRGNGKSIRYGLCMALDIIDKYKAEREDEE